MHCRNESGNVAWSKAESIFDIVAHGLGFVDFNRDVFQTEILTIFDITNGGIGYKDLLEMDFDMYDEILDKCVKVQKSIKEKMEHGRNWS